MVFLCEGNIESVLKKYGLCGNENTQAVLNFKIMTKGARPQDFRVDMGTDSFGEPKIAGETVVCGKWADALMARLNRANIQSSKVGNVFRAAPSIPPLLVLEPLQSLPAGKSSVARGTLLVLLLSIPALSLLGIDSNISRLLMASAAKLGRTGHASPPTN